MEVDLTGMAANLNSAFESLQHVLAEYADQLVVKTDTASEYTLVTRSPSPFPQHKGEPLFFASVKFGKAYVSYHLLPLYMCPKLIEKISDPLKKRMQGKACFNFKSAPDPGLLLDLKRLTSISLGDWAERKWL